jgi:hypothetical protein
MTPTSGTTDAVEIDDLRVVRGGKVVLDGLSLTVPAGSGSVRVLGLPAGAAELRAPVAYATQAASVYDDLSASDTSPTSPPCSERPPATSAGSSTRSGSRRRRTLSSRACLAVSAPASPSSQSSTPCSAARSASSSARLPAPSSKRCSSCRPSCWPQFPLCGLLVPREELGRVLEAISDVLPLSYAVDAMQRITLKAEVSARLLADLGVVVLAIVLSLTLGAATLRRRTE